MHRKRNLVSHVEDLLVEDRHIRTSLETCGYPKWIFDKVVTTSREKGTKSNTKKNRQSSLKH